LIRPTVQAAGSFSVLLSNPSKIAAAGRTGDAAAGNTGSAAISSGTVYAANPNLLATTTLTFTTATTYSINARAALPTRRRQRHAKRLAGADQRHTRAGDTFTVKSNAGGTATIAMRC